MKKFLLIAALAATTIQAHAGWWIFESDSERIVREAREQCAAIDAYYNPPPIPRSDSLESERQALQDRLDEIAEMKREALADKFFGRGNHY